jgi:hypothetical protein
MLNKIKYFLYYYSKFIQLLLEYNSHNTIHCTIKNQTKKKILNIR